MHHRTHRRAALWAAAAVTAVGSLIGAAPAMAAGDRLYTPPAPDGSQRQITALRAAHDKEGAALIEQEVSTPQAVWFTSGTPDEVRKAVKKTVARANGHGSVPTLVAYYLPYRDCGQYSSGGATDTATYEAWVDAFAAGIGSSKATVILEPDGLGLIPNYASRIDGSSNCSIDPPAGVDLATDPGAAPTPENRFEQLDHAVQVLSKNPGTRVYLDATHSAWQNVGESADRLEQAGVAGAAGFFLNVSNYQYTANQAQYGTWVSQCLAHVAAGGKAGDCPNQFWNGGPSNSFNGVALRNDGQWSDDATDPTLNTKGINERYATLSGADTPTAHFVVDTSRNGQGPWVPPADTYPDPQDWCNPPARGLGERPTTATGVPLMDAKLWVKTPGQSDGQCNRGVAGSTTDPEWGGTTDPAAGDWFPEQALQLAELAVPPLRG